jgi:hypothetical protein
VRVACAERTTEPAVRAYEFAAGDRLILTPVGGTNQITWERMK